VNASLRLATLLLAVAIVPLILCAPALAQTGPVSEQYVGESPETFADNTEQGTDAVNDAMSGTASPSASPSASGEGSVAPEEDTPENDADGGAQAGDGGSAEADAGGEASPITELPDTGGPSLAALGLGVLLAVFGLTARRLIGR